MPHYFFHVRDGLSPPDATGLRIDAVADLRREAVRRAAFLLFDAAGRISIPPGWHLDVTDEAGTLVFRLAFPETAAAGDKLAAACSVSAAKP